MAALLGGAAPLGTHAAETGGTLRIGWTPWASSEATVRVAARVFRRRLGYEVELVQATTPFLYSALAERELDVFLASWQPDAHADFMRSVSEHVAGYGILYHGAQLGWAVPKRTTPARIDAIPALRHRRVRRALNGVIHGVDAGTGIMQVSRRALDSYRLQRYRLKPSSDAGAAAAVERALRRGRPVVVTARQPHWMFDAYQLRYLADPKGALGGPQRVHKLARRGFAGDHPWASKVLARMTLPRRAVQRILTRGRGRGYRRAAARYLQTHPARVRYWVTGAMPGRETP